MQMKFSGGQSKFSRMFNFAIIGYWRNSQKLDACEKLVFYSIFLKAKFLLCMHLQSALAIAWRLSVRLERVKQ